MRRVLTSAIAVAVALGVAFVLSLRCVHADPPRIGIMVSQEDAPFKEVITGFQQALNQQGGGATFDEYPLQGDATKAGPAVQEAKQKGTRLLLTVGTLATQATLQEATGIPIVAALAVSEEELRKAGNATGVLIDFGIDTQLQWMRKFLPDATLVGVPFNPKKTGTKVSGASQTAKQLGLQLVTREVETAAALREALEDFANNAKILWGITDQTLFSPQTAEAVLLFSFRNRIPFVAPSTSWVKAGALYALDRDYRDIGVQCGELAAKVLAGASVNSLPPVAPRKIVYGLNLKTANHMKLDIVQALIDGAQHVFK